MQLLVCGVLVSNFLLIAALAVDLRNVEMEDLEYKNIPKA